MSVVSEWCKKRHLCWNLPVSVFRDPIVYDNWLRQTCKHESRKLILQGLKVRVRFTNYPDSECKLQVATPEQIQHGWIDGVDVSTEEIWLQGTDAYAKCYVFNEFDLVWSYEEYAGWSFLPYDLPNVLHIIACRQVRTFCQKRLPKAIISYIAVFACEIVSKDDCFEGEDLNDYRRKIEMEDWQPKRQKTKEKKTPQKKNRGWGRPKKPKTKKE